MKGYIKNKTIVLIDPLPEHLQDGDEVEISLTLASTQNLPFPTFNLGIKDEYLERDRYEAIKMTEREQLLQELEQAPDELIAETLNFVRSTKAKQSEHPMTPIDIAALQAQIPKTPKERSRRLREWVASLPKNTAELPEEALHRDTMYD